MSRMTGPRITGLGGVFYVVSDPEATQAWYREKLGVDGEYGPQFAWEDEPKEKPYSLVSHFKDDEYIKPGVGGGYDQSQGRRPRWFCGNFEVAQCGGAGHSR